MRYIYLVKRMNVLISDKKQEVRFSVSGTPQPKSRPRFTKSGHAYTATKTKDYEKLIGQCAWVKMAHSKIKTTKSPVHFEMIAYFPIPKSWSERKRMQALAGAIRPSKPDLDNLIKAVLDGCNKIVYEDDQQVYSVWAKKVYETWDVKPSIVISFSWT